MNLSLLAALCGDLTVSSVIAADKPTSVTIDTFTHLDHAVKISPEETARSIAAA